MPPDRSSQKLRRWIDLIVALLRRRQAAAFDEFKGDVPQYATSSAAPESVLRTFERDKDELAAFGVPIEVSADQMGVRRLYRLTPGDFFLPYLELVDAEQVAARKRPRTAPRLETLAFTPDELDLVVRAGRRAQQLGDPRLALDAANALRKIAFDMPVPGPDATESVRVGPQHEDPEILDQIDRALRARKIILFDYHSIARDSHERREVEPWGLVFLARHWYVLGNERAAQSLKRFRVSRMRDLAVNQKAPHTPDFAVPPSFDISAYARWRQAWELGDGDTIEVVVRFTGVANHVAEAAGLGLPVAGAPADRRYEVRNTDAFARWLLRLTGDACPVAPPAFVATWRALVERTVAAYGGAR